MTDGANSRSLDDRGDPFDDDENDVLTEHRHAPSMLPPAHRRRRSRATRQQKIAVASIAAIGGVIGAISGTDATGHWVIDVIYRAVFVVALTYAGSRARRWSLVVAAALAAIGSVGLALLCSFVALGVGVFMVARDMRDRVIGSVVGALVAIALLHLHVTWFLGSSIILGFVACGCIALSGYRNSSRQTKRRVRLGSIGVATLFVIGVGMAIYQVVAYEGPLSSAVQRINAGLGQLENGKSLEAADNFGSAGSKFREVSEASDQILFLPSHLIPVVAQNLDVVTVLSESGAQLSESAARSTRDVDYERLRREGGGIDLSALEDFAAPVHDAADRLSHASDSVETLNSPWILGPLADRVDQFSEKVQGLKAEADLAAIAVDRAPALLGGETSRRYLVLVGNPAEARDIGGHIGNWAELTVVDGVLSLEQVGKPLDLSNPEVEDLLPQSDLFPQSLLEMQPAMYPQNWGGWVDFRTDAKLAATLFEMKTGRRIDGVFYADPFVLAQMLKISGAVPMAGPQKSVNASNIVKFLTLDQYTKYDQSREADPAITEMTKELFRKFTSTKLPGPRSMSQRFGPLVREGRLRFVSMHDADGALLEELGLNNGFSRDAGSDLLAVVNRNANPSKIDSFLTRSTTYSVKWDPRSGHVTSTVRITLKNSAPASGLPEYVIDNAKGYPSGTNVTAVSVITPFELNEARIDDENSPAVPLFDRSLWRHTVTAAIPAGGSVTVEFDLEGEIDSGSHYRLRTFGQPLVEPGTTRVTVDTSEGKFEPGDKITVIGQRASATMSGAGQTVLTLSES